MRWSPEGWAAAADTILIFNQAFKTNRFVFLYGLTIRSILVAAFVAAWQHYRTIPLLVLGQPQSVGLLQRETDLPLLITYQTADSFGLKDAHQLEALRDGRVDIVSLRFM